MTEPACPYFGRCGGCAYQDMPYADQLKHKLQTLQDYLQFENIHVFSGESYHYRTRMDFVFHAGGLGLREKGFWDRMVDIDQCLISCPRLNNLLQEVRSFFNDVFYFDVRRRFGTFCYAVIRTPPGDSSISIVLNKKSKKLQDGIDQVQEFAEITTADNVLVTLIPHNRNVSVSEDFFVLKGSSQLDEEYLGKKFFYPVQGFSQVNHKMTERLLAYCRELLTKYSGKDTRLYDLYSGAGTFGIINAPFFQHVTLAENYAPAIEAGKKNLIRNDIKNADSIIMPDKQFPKLELASPYALLMDPPRSGVHPRINPWLDELNPEGLVYVSCNPKLLRRDLEDLQTYHIKSAALFDLFPQTPHMETVIELEKN
jgi:tRNA (uracil-5-)-methyltransferase